MNVLAGILMAASLLGVPQEMPKGAWISICDLLSDGDSASIVLDELLSLGFEEAGIMELSSGGPEGWGVYSGVHPDKTAASHEACLLLWRFPRIMYCRMAGDTLQELRRPIPSSLEELLGIIPPTQDFTRQSPVPDAWRTEWTVIGEGDEWTRPVRIASSPPGWLLEEWEDPYAGTVELRAFHSTIDPGRELDMVTALLDSVSGIMELEIISVPEEFVLVHRLPDPMDRTGDWDLWACAVPGGLQYGIRVRSFYGEEVYSRHQIPEMALGTALPQGPSSWREAADMLLAVLEDDGVYDARTLSAISVSPENEGSVSDFFDLVIREVHLPGGDGDPSTAPVLDRFRVYGRCGEIIWLHPLYGRYLPYDRLLKAAEGEAEDVN